MAGMIQQYKEQLLEAKRLILILDLDHTLLHSVCFNEVEPTLNGFLENKAATDKDLLRVHQLQYWTKIRPGVKEFLEKASRLFELHVNTMGKCDYARKMVELLDPTGSLFGGRLVYKKHDRQKLKSLEGVMGMESTMIIVDDKEKVWPDNIRNLIQVKKYNYFKHKSEGKRSRLYSSVRKNSKERREGNAGLAPLLTLLEQIHRSFFEQPELNEVDVRNVVQKAADTFIEV